MTAGKNSAAADEKKHQQSNAQHITQKHIS
jgi:hypothetical protein